MLKIKNMENDGKNHILGSKKKSRHCSVMTDNIIVRGDGLTIDDVVRVARRGAGVCLTEEEGVLQRIKKSHNFIMRAVESNQSIYGVTTVFGGMSNISVSREDAEALQNNIPWSHKSGAGKKLPIADVRASMLLRANSLMRGASGVRLEIIQRLVDFLNADITPHMYELGSIGASGDLVPLSYILGAVIGLDPSFSVDMKGKETDSISALKFLNLPRLHSLSKRGSGDDKRNLGDVCYRSELCIRCSNIAGVDNGSTCTIYSGIMRIETIISSIYQLPKALSWTDMDFQADAPSA